jgi:hypothetical protein
MGGQKGFHPMTVTVFLPIDRSPGVILRQQIAAAIEHFQGYGPITYLAHSPILDAHQCELPDINLKPIDGPRVCRPDHVVRLGVVPRYPDNLLVHDSPAATHWMIDWCGRLSHQLGTSAVVDQSEIDTLLGAPGHLNIFEALGPKDSQMGFFPYGYTYRLLGLGAINSMGFRVPEDYARFRDRASTHKLIVCLGGSGCWSIRCLASQTFSKVMEKVLNGQAAASESKNKFTVLNFGYLNNLIVHEMINFLLFCMDLRPDVVIAHDGYNDLLYGQLQNSDMLEKYQIIYHENLEEWSQILHDSQDVPRSQESKMPVTLNHAIPILKAYVRRKFELADLVASRGAKFIWGLQPMWSSKGELNDLERHLVANLAQNHYFASVNTGSMFDYLSEKLIMKPGLVTVDFHKIFSEFGADRFFMADPVHLSAHADDVVGKRYAQEIAGMFLNLDSAEKTS